MHLTESIYINMLYCTGTLIFKITVLNISSLCKAEEGGDTVASLADGNAALAQFAGAVFTVIYAMLY